MSTITKKELIDRIAERTQTKRVAVKSVIQAFLDEIVEELKITRVAERAGRAQDKEKAYTMQNLRALGYM